MSKVPFYFTKYVPAGLLLVSTKDQIKYFFKIVSITSTLLMLVVNIFADIQLDDFYHWLQSTIKSSLRTGISKRTIEVFEKILVKILSDFLLKSNDYV
jgi:hypothetical protein